MREHPDFQLRSAEFPMPEIMIGRYAPLSCPTLDGFRMKAPEDGGSVYAIEKRFRGLKQSRGRGGLSSGTEPLRDAQVNACI